MNIERKPGRVSWAKVALLAALVLYPLSFGPACWIASRSSTAERVVEVVYTPLAKAAWVCPGMVMANLLFTWGSLGESPRQASLKDPSPFLAWRIIMTSRPSWKR